MKPGPALLLGVLLLASAAPLSAFPLRVLVEGPKSTLKIAVSAPAQLRQDNGGTVDLLPGQWFTVRRENSGVVQLPPEGLVLVGDRWYPESVQFRWLRGGLLAVNFVDSETYLRGVVPREMPSSYGDHALMAQAVAARTYALTSWVRRKHGPHYDLVDTVVDQVYGGFARYNPRTGKSTLLTHPRTDRAVAATRDQFLDYSKAQGFYRAEGIAGWVRYGEYSLPVPKGRMLSQKVSQMMAQAGWNYHDILAYWYKSHVYQIAFPG
ncbi:SpoIID/LytB domain-containing protein [Gloeobacter morelensis]|uniref:SpoIID/LytB domain-containing protein n=1 Tax=Gloeobacter morelensis MG652769 TaxID=2781736 RepID=A0ABY3PPV4_9CYAN|nr:SpoIID/LytB domain-containing protein [Gloeobacter morelensis]UFP95676.1 SpoIID/LytB domain-containing protein [Gloeobacter morelensis MG652769]